MQTGRPQSCAVASRVCFPQNAHTLQLCCLAPPAAGPAACAASRCVWQTVTASLFLHDQTQGDLHVSDPGGARLCGRRDPGEPGFVPGVTPGESGSVAGVTPGDPGSILV